MVAIPSEGCDEKRVVHRIKEEMEKVGFDKVEIDPTGQRSRLYRPRPASGWQWTLISIPSGHWQHQKLGLRSVRRHGNWSSEFGGRGTSDEEGGMASMVYAGKIIKDLGLEDEYTLLVTGTVQEEDCDGLCWQYIIEQSGIRPEFVVSTEPTDCQIYRGQRGRMGIY